MIGLSKQPDEPWSSREHVFPDKHKKPKARPEPEPEPPPAPKPQAKTVAAKAATPARRGKK